MHAFTLLMRLSITHIFWEAEKSAGFIEQASLQTLKKSASQKMWVMLRLEQGFQSGQLLIAEPRSGTRAALAANPPD